MKRKTDVEREILKSYLEEVHDFMDKHHYNSLDIADTELEQNLMNYLKSVGFKVVCPACGSLSFVKDGKSKTRLQKYKCKNKNCGKKFTIFTDTVLDRTRYPIPIILDVIKYMIDGESLAFMHRNLKQKYPDTYSFEEDTLSHLRLNIMVAIHNAQLKYLKVNKLRGTVQIDETYFHENQSGTPEKKQINPNEEIKGKRKSLVNKKGHSKRRHLPPSSDDFSNVVVAVDNRGLCIGALIGVGATDDSQLQSKIMDYIDFDKVEILCTDGEPNFKKYGKDTVHFILNSSYYKAIETVGMTDSLGNVITEETLFNKGDLGKIVKDGKSLNFESFKAYTHKYYLSLNRVNSLHASLKDSINKRHNSVVTKNLQYYVSWYCFLKNYTTIFSGQKVYDKSALMRILAIALYQDVKDNNIPKTKLKQRSRKNNEIAWIESKDLKTLLEKDKRVKMKLVHKDATLLPDAHLFDKSPTEAIKFMKKGELQDFAAFCNIKNSSTMKVNELRTALYKVKDLERKILQYDLSKELVKSPEKIAKSVEERIDFISQKERDLGRTLSPHETINIFFDKDAKVYDFKDVKKKNPQKILFLDTETTGVKDDDEILELAIVDGYGTVVFHEFFKPMNHTEWDDAEAVNHISPSDVKNKKHVTEYYHQLKEIFKDAETLIIYNAKFDIKYIRKITDGRVLRKFKANFSKPEQSLLCCMVAFEDYTGRKSNYKLVDAIDYFNIKCDNNKLHGALYDAEMTRQVWLHMFPNFYKGL